MSESQKINDEYIELCKSRGHLELSIDLSKEQIDLINKRVVELRRLHSEALKKEKELLTPDRVEKDQNATHKE